MRSPARTVSIHCCSSDFDWVPSAAGLDCNPSRVPVPVRILQQHHPDRSTHFRIPVCEVTAPTHNIWVSTVVHWAGYTDRASACTTSDWRLATSHEQTGHADRPSGFSPRPATVTRPITRPGSAPGRPRPANAQLPSPCLWLHGRVIRIVVSSHSQTTPPTRASDERRPNCIARNPRALRGTASRLWHTPPPAVPPTNAHAGSLRSVAGRFSPVSRYRGCHGARSGNGAGR